MELEERKRREGVQRGRKEWERGVGKGSEGPTGAAWWPSPSN